MHYRLKVFFKSQIHMPSLVKIYNIIKQISYLRSNPSNNRKKINKIEFSNKKRYRELCYLIHEALSYIETRIGIKLNNIINAL